MSLIDLWRESKTEISEKHVQQIVTFAGDGRLSDGNQASSEFRAFLSQVPSVVLVKYAAQCLEEGFANSGLVLQDIVNEIGKRLGFKVIHGRYRGSAGQIGFDGVWESADGHGLVVEVKTTDAYRIDLNVLADYRRGLIRTGKLLEDQSSILIVVGRQDTGDLEPQIRGSRHGWDVRLISTEALLRLLRVKEELEDPRTQNQIHAMLRPREFTRLDEIVDLLFSAAEDIKQENAEEEDVSEPSESPKERKPKFTPVAFHEACVHRLERALGVTLIKRSRTAYRNDTHSLHVICAVSREHARSGSFSYWFAFHPHQREYLAEVATSYVAFGCGSESQLLLVPFSDFKKWLDGMNETTNEDRSYKHVSIFRSGEQFELVRRQGLPRIDLTGYLVREP